LKKGKPPDFPAVFDSRETPKGRRSWISQMP
jgi:hypothetical protein